MTAHGRNRRATSRRGCGRTGSRCVRGVAGLGCGAAECFGFSPGHWRLLVLGFIFLIYEVILNILLIDFFVLFIFVCIFDRF